MHEIVADAALYAPEIHEIEGHAVGHQHTYGAVLGQDIEIACPCRRFELNRQRLPIHGGGGARYRQRRHNDDGG